MTIGDTIRTLRKKRDWNRSDMARATSLQVNSLYMIETGRRQPTVDSLSRIAAALGVTVDRLIRGSV